VPPSANTFHRKLRRVMIKAHIHEPLIMHQIIDSIRDCFAICQRKKIIDIDGRFFSSGLPLSSIVFERAKEFLFLAIHRNDGVPLVLKLVALLLDLSKLESSTSRSAVSAMVCPIACKATFRCATLLLVHLSKLIGSPFGSRSPSRSARSMASFSLSFLRPPPFARCLCPGV